MMAGERCTTSTRMIDIREVVERVALSPSTVRRLVLGGDFPRPLQLGRQAQRWRIDEIDDHMERLARAKSAGTAA